MAMPETTFAGSMRGQWDFFRDAGVYLRETEFMRLGFGIFESEDLTDNIYAIFLSLFGEKWMANNDGLTRIDDIGMMYKNGFYMPCIERIVLSGQVDLRNDELPDYAALVTVSSKSKPDFVSIRKAKPPIRQVVPPPFSQSYALTLYDRDDKEKITAATMYVAVMADGRVVPATYFRFHGDISGEYATVYGLGCQAAAAAINAQQDARHLWLVKTQENIIGACQTPLTLGVGEEHVKSLFYARQAPLTAAGRRRPILHWVQSHRRRLKQGIDVDVRKHLRGIDEFEMDSFNFRITQPRRDGHAA